MRWWHSFVLVSTLALWTVCAGLQVQHRLREEAGVEAEENDPRAEVDANSTLSSDASGYMEQGFNIQSASGSRDDETGQTTPGQVSVWTPEAMTEATIRIALDPVRYRNNYEKYTTTQLCLYRINLIRSRLVDDLQSYLFSVDGCESTKITLTGRCDIYYCKLATYELKVTQKTVDKDVYIVQSIFKALTQKSMSELMQPTNLDYKDPVDTSYEENDSLAVKKVADGSTIPVFVGAATTTQATTAVTTSSSRHDANLQVKAVELPHMTEAEMQIVTWERVHARLPPPSIKVNEVLGRPVFTAIPELWFIVSAAAVAVATIGIASVVAYRQHHHTSHTSHRMRRRDRQQRRRYHHHHPEQIPASLASPMSSELSQLLASNDDSNAAV